jgi:hypothetical protein
MSAQGPNEDMLSRRRLAFLYHFRTALPELAPAIVDNAAGVRMLFRVFAKWEAGENPARSRHCNRSATHLTADSQTPFVIGSTLTGRAIPGGFR